MSRLVPRLRFGPSARALVAALAVTTLVAGCGTNSESGSESSASATRVISGTVLGDVQVPAQPKRVLAGWLVGTLLVDIGITPVGMFDDLKDNASPTALAKVKDVPTVGGPNSSVNLEKIVELNPDLIVTMTRPGIKNLDLKALQDIAPTVALEVPDPPAVWANYAKLADVVGKGSDATQRLTDLDKAWTDIAAANKDKLAKIGQVVYAEGSAQAGNFQIATNKALTYERLTKSGFTYFAGADPNPARYQQQISMEDLPRLATANAIFFEADIQGQPTQRTKALLDSPVFKALPAAKAGNLFPIRTPYTYTFESANLQLEDVRNAVQRYTTAA
ncbi:ABC transporter substrate-binding protein [Nocardia sp. NPDC049149]|uniref:ABC transporter substrate-binding protein n=1 Tax=Nocardia sp. NPDC049149 TaxID=3364315 RepID=UPI00371D21AB